jgi:membrane dipeptidase
LMLTKKGYSEQDIENIMSQNFIKFLQKVWR